MSKRIGHVLGMDLAQQAGEAANTRETWKAKQRVKSQGKTNITFFLARSTHTRLKEIAVERNTSLQQLVAEAVDMWLAKQTEPVPYKPTD